MNKILILSIASVLFTGCSLFPSAWKSARSGGETVAPTSPAAPSAEAGQTVEELDAQVQADLQTQMNADLNQVDQDLKAIDEEVKNY